ncbi:MAG: WecB/TagA/CpsF family glycosyltransferase [Pseudomonadota bacterium]
MTAAQDQRAVRRHVLGCPVDPVTLDHAADLAVRAMHSGGRMQHCAVNTAKLVAMRRNPELAADVTSSDLITADGMGLVLAARLTGQSLPERVTGIDLMQKLMGRCAQDGLRPYLLGARPHVLEKAASRLEAQFHGLRIAGLQHGYFSPGEEAEIVSTINASGADCLFVALPTPGKERFLARHGHALNVPFVMGVGGSFDVIAGHVRRAPRWMQGAGLEWVYRLCQEPRRMWRRYLVTNSIFAVLLCRALAARAVAASPVSDQ